jgi:hypothetical protein
MEPAKGIFELIAEIERGSDHRWSDGSHNRGSSAHPHGFRRPISPMRPGARRLATTRTPKPKQIVSPPSSGNRSRPRSALHPDKAVTEAMHLARTAAKPVILADIQDNPGASGASDTVGLLRAPSRTGRRVR